jgi:tRNA uridine 5-carboxymethylaminomethyl modification enzyme
MFTSRAEYRLLLRQDNADLRLMEKGHNIGLINRDQFSTFTRRKKEIEKELKRIKSVRVKPGAVNPVLETLGTSPVKEDTSLYQLLKRPEVTYADIAAVSPSGNGISSDVINQVEIQAKYKGYIRRQIEQAEKFKKIEGKIIPEGFTYRGINGLSTEIVEKLEEVRPLNLGQAGRIPGVTPAAIALLMIAVEKQRRKIDTDRQQIPSNKSQKTNKLQ